MRAIWTSFNRVNKTRRVSSSWSVFIRIASSASHFLLLIWFFRADGAWPSAKPHSLTPNTCALLYTYTYNIHMYVCVYVFQHWSIESHPPAVVCEYPSSLCEVAVLGRNSARTAKKLNAPDSIWSLFHLSRLVRSLDVCNSNRRVFMYVCTYKCMREQRKVYAYTYII